jgi:hypothetical protein
MRTPSVIRTFRNRRFIAPALTLALGQLACIVQLHQSYEYGEVTKKRSADQVHFQDSLKVFFVDYVNPYPDKEVLWFSSYLEGPVEMEIHDAGNDSLEAVYRFEPQEMPLYAVAYRSDSNRLVKCVIRVNNQPKCARLCASFYPLPQPQWGTTYTVEREQRTGD